MAHHMAENQPYEKDVDPLLGRFGTISLLELLMAFFVFERSEKSSSARGNVTRKPTMLNVQSGNAWNFTPPPEKTLLEM